MNKVVNPHFLSVFLDPLTGLADSDEAIEYYRSIPLANEQQYKAVIRDTIVKYYNTISERKQYKAKLALSYYLTEGNIDFEGVFDAELLPFSPPHNARDFFVWIWEELFKGESYFLADHESYTVVDDYLETNEP